MVYRRHLVCTRSPCTMLILAKILGCKKANKDTFPLATISTEAVFAPRNHHKSHKDFNFKLERDTKKLATLFSPLFKKTMDV